MDAALSLGKIGATDAVPDLKAMMSDPEVRSYAAVALARLGDPDGEAVVQELLKSSVLDMRLLGAQAYEGKGTGPWVQAVMPALQDPNGLTRIRAAEMLAPVAPEAALPVLLEASKDPNPVVRADVMRVFERTGLLAASQQEPGPTSKSEGPTALDALRRMLQGSRARHSPLRGRGHRRDGQGGSLAARLHIFALQGAGRAFTLLLLFPRADNAA